MITLDPQTGCNAVCTGTCSRLVNIILICGARFGGEFRLRTTGECFLLGLINWSCSKVECSSFKTHGIF